MSYIQTVGLVVFAVAPWDDQSCAVVQEYREPVGRCGSDRVSIMVGLWNRYVKLIKSEDS